MRRSRAPLIPALAALCFSLAACEGNPIDAMASFSTITCNLSIATIGEDLDPDGYTLRLDPLELEMAVAIEDEVSVRDLSKGTEYFISIEGVADNCVVARGVRRRVYVEETDIHTLAVRHRFEVACVAGA